MAHYLEGLEIHDIARILHLTYRQVEAWWKVGEWEKLRQQVRQDVSMEVADQFRAIQKKHFSPVVERQLRLAEKLSTHIEQHLDKKQLPTRSVAEMARSTAAFSDVTSRAIGLNRLSETEQRPLLVQVGVAVKIAEEKSSTPATLTASATELPALPEPPPF